ncbi:hypothetical protein AAH972_13860 [Enterococcus faecalis]|uniref:hypothetical protein n=1 Tax=Enterococcus faecalis TaxID=1351 RepID=UPI0031CD6816
MPDILLRKLSQKTVAGLDDLAKQKSKSREAYAKSVLASHVASVEFTLDSSLIGCFFIS